jgi:hypothetical protein
MRQRITKKWLNNIFKNKVEYVSIYSGFLVPPLWNEVDENFKNKWTNERGIEKVYIVDDPISHILFTMEKQRRKNVYILMCIVYKNERHYLKKNESN